VSGTQQAPTLLSDRCSVLLKDGLEGGGFLVPELTGKDDREGLEAKQLEPVRNRSCHIIR